MMFRAQRDVKMPRYMLLVFGLNIYYCTSDKAVSTRRRISFWWSIPGLRHGVIIRQAQVLCHLPCRGSARQIFSSAKGVDAEITFVVP